MPVAAGILMIMCICKEGELEYLGVMQQSLQLSSLSMPLWLGLLDESTGGDSGVCSGAISVEKISVINSVEFDLLSLSLTSSRDALALEISSLELCSLSVDMQTNVS